MIDRVLKNWKTTAIGLLVLAVCFALVFADKASLTEVGAFMCGGFYVLFSKDSLLKKKGMLLLAAGMMMIPALAGCRTLREYEHVSEVVRRDTIREKDTVRIRLFIQGDTVVKYRERIRVDTLLIRELRDGRFAVQPWDTCTRYAYAKAGITNNIPWLLLEQRDILVDTAVYVERIRILEERLRETERLLVKEDRFYENVWFWVSICLGLLVLLKLRHAQH